MRKLNPCLPELMCLSGEIILADRLTKQYVEHHPEQFQGQKKLNGWIRLKLFHNCGIAGGSLNKQTKKITIFSALLLTLIPAAMAVEDQEKHPCWYLGLACLFGGGVGNLIDRSRRGEVTDYLGFSKLPGRLGTLLFNVADFFIFFGAALTVLAEFITTDPIGDGK